MLMLALTIIANTSFALIVRAAQRGGANDVAVRWSTTCLRAASMR